MDSTRKSEFKKLYCKLPYSPDARVMSTQIRLLIFNSRSNSKLTKLPDLFAKPVVKFKGHFQVILITIQRSSNHAHFST